MRWDSFFEDLEAQVDEQNRAQLRDEIAENIRIERATAQLIPVLSHFRGQELAIQLTGGTEIRAELGPCALDYLCMESAQSQWIIRMRTVEAVVLPAGRIPMSGENNPRTHSIKFSTVLRRFFRDRALCQIYNHSGTSLAEGTLAQVGKDFLVVLVHPRDEFARPERISASLLIPFESIGWVEAQVLS